MRRALLLLCLALPALALDYSQPEKFLLHRPTGGVNGGADR